MNLILEKIGEIGIIPVIVLNDLKDAEPLADALCKGGLACAEVTFRTEVATEVIKVMSEKYPEMLVGAGTVLTIEQAEEAVLAGAKFIVSPGYDQEVVDYCLKSDIPVIPGVSTPSEVIQAVKCGLEVVKVFPAEQIGGINMIKALSGPFTNMRFMATGGINSESIVKYLKFEKMLACGGSWMVKDSLINAGKYDEIEKMVRESVEIVKKARG